MKNFGELIKKRTEYSPLVGMFQTEVGPLNRVLHIWEYEDVAHRETVRSRVVSEGIWPPNNSDFIVNMQSDIYKPAPFMPQQARERRIGPIFELRVYRYPNGAIPKVIDAWGSRIEARMSLCPSVGIWHSDIGPLNMWAHMWAYESWEHRAESRSKFSEIGWPPKSGVAPIAQENMLLTAPDFSPVK